MKGANLASLVLLVHNYLLLVTADFLGLVIPDKSVLETADTDGILNVEVDFDSNYVSRGEIENSHMCFLVNGAVCHCFEGVYHELIPTLKHSCLPRHSWSFLWFSVQLTIPSNSSSTNRIIRSTPIYVINKKSVQVELPPLYMLTFVLPLTIDDLSRAAVLLHTLRSVPLDTVHELLIFTPDAQHASIKETVMTLTRGFNFSTVVSPESQLFCRAPSDMRTYPYALQMAVKLLAATRVKTAFYITLDADVVLLQPERLAQAVQYSLEGSVHKALFDNEPRDVHPAWWQGSEAFLRLSQPTHGEGSTFPVQQHEKNMHGFGVTPAVLSTYGSLLALSAVRDACLARLGITAVRSTTLSVNGDTIAVDVAAAVEEMWLDGFGRREQEKGALWSEYTLYRLALDKYQVFSGLHTEQSDLLLHCGDVWYAEQLPWKLDASIRSRCIFSVIQSTTGVDPSDILNELK